METAFDELCNEFRGIIEDLKPKVKFLMKHGVFTGEQIRADQHSEMKANVMLAYRHLEDARMRLGKAIQASTASGGSCYSK